MVFESLPDEPPFFGISKILNEALIPLVGDRSIWMRNFEEDLYTQDWKQTHNSIENKNTIDGIFKYRAHTLAFHRTPIYRKKKKKRS